MAPTISGVVITQDERQAAQWAVKADTPAGQKLLATLKSDSVLNRVPKDVLTAAVSEWETAGRPDIGHRPSTPAGTAHRTR
jgi:hypothetical protein